MKTKLLTLVALAISCATFGQAPEAFKYQAVVRNAGGAIITNQSVGYQLTILQGSPSGTAVYTETFTPTSNSYGLVNLEIGTGTTVDDFSAIDWANGPYYIETAADLTGGTSYVLMGTSQLVSVPYALYAKSAENVTNDQVDDADADPTNEIQDISLTGTNLTITSGSTVDLSSLQDGTGTDNQQLTLAGTNLSIEDGNTVNLSVLQDGVDDADNDPTNELQSWSTLPGIPTSLSNTLIGTIKAPNTPPSGLPTILVGTGFSVNSTGLGEYQITFDTPYNSTPVVVASINMQLGNIGWVLPYNVSSTGFQVRTYWWNMSGFSDAIGFSFIVSGD